MSYIFEHFPKHVAEYFDGNLPPNFGDHNIKASIVIPIRGTARQQPLEVCLWNTLMIGEKNIEIIVSEEDSNKKIDLSKFSEYKNIKHIFTQSSELFNKSRAINYGVAAASNEMVIMNDVDILMPNNYFRTLSKYANMEFFYLCKDIHYADLHENRIVYNGDSWSKHPERFEVVGGNCAFNKNAFARIGRMYERFVGYGSEDGEFYTRAKHYYSSHGRNKMVLSIKNHLIRTKFCEERTLNFIHLNHEYEKNNSDNVMKNFEMYARLKKIPIQQRIKIVSNNLICPIS